MKKVILLLGCFLITACVTMSADNPKFKSALREAQANLNKCLAEQINDLISVYPEPEMVVQVAATRCEYTAMQEAQKLRALNANKNVIRGFNSKLTDNEEIKNQARNILMFMIEEANQ